MVRKKPLSCCSSYSFFNPFRWLLAALPLLSVAQGDAAAAKLEFGVASASLKVRRGDHPQLQGQATLKAARNEFEAFQIVLRASDGTVEDVSVRLSKALKGPSDAQIPDHNVVLYRAGYYYVSVASNAEGASGYWPDPLIPDRDVYYNQKRRAFPIKVPDEETRLVWVDILVPIDAAAGTYRGELEVLVAGTKVGTVPVSLRVGAFTLPSTASLKSAFALDYAQPCMAHTGTDTCDITQWNEEAALTLRELYVRSALDHRFTLHDVFFQPPRDGSEKPFEKIMLPLVTGTGKTRLPGAKVTTVRMMLTEFSKDYDIWYDFANKHGFADRLFYYPVDEPSGSQWDEFVTMARDLHDYNPNGKTILTSSMQDAEDHGVTDYIDIFVPVINQIEERPNAGTPYDGNQRPKYDSWLKVKPGRELWAYQSCQSHGCGACGQYTDGLGATGWPSHVIDASAVQARAFPWIAFIYDIKGELYFNTSEQLSTAWQRDGQCKYSGSGDGTLFYPGTPDEVGGTKDIPIESIRMKMIREGMEDYEYLVLAAKRDRSKTMEIARKLFPKTYAAAQPPQAVEQARDQLFAMLDTTEPKPPPKPQPAKDPVEVEPPQEDPPQQDPPQQDPPQSEPAQDPVVQREAVPPAADNPEPAGSAATVPSGDAVPERRRPLLPTGEAVASTGSLAGAQLDNVERNRIAAQRSGAFEGHPALRGGCTIAHGAASSGGPLWLALLMCLVACRRRRGA